MTDQTRTMMTEDQAAAAMGMTVAELRELHAAGDGPTPFTITVHVVRYTPGDVEAWRAAHAAIDIAATNHETATTDHEDGEP